MKQQNFASDNNAPISPQAFQAWVNANANHVPGYGGDALTDTAKCVLQRWLGCEATIVFLPGGTAANCLALSTSLQSYHSVICHEWAHILTDECHAPAFFKPGIQLQKVAGSDGKIDPDTLQPIFSASHGIHGTLPRMVSITQATEAGTVYSVQEIQTLCQTARELDLLVHVDGARFFNAWVSLGCDPADISWRAGVDLLSLGGVKNGLGLGEALIVFKSESTEGLEYRIKQSGQLISKMRFLSAPWIPFIESGECMENARKANRMAAMLATRLQAFPDITLLFPVQANAVFCTMPSSVYESMTNLGWSFYPFPLMGGYRLMCAWDTSEDDVECFIKDLERLIHSEFKSA